MYNGSIGQRAKISREQLRRRFRRAMPSYEKAAVVQRRMAVRLAEVLAELSSFYSRVLEIGAGTGFFTRAAKERFSWSLYLACDLLPECACFLEPLGVHFVVANGEDPSWVRGPFDLIVSNAVFQWFEDLGKSLLALAERLCPGGFLAFTTFGPDTMKEIPREPPPGLLSLPHLTSLKPPGLEEIQAFCWQEILYFEEPLAVLRHIRETGALGGLPTRWSLRALKAWQQSYERYKLEEGYPLTFEPILVIWRKVG